jgi:hypothetical protein
MGSLYTQHGFFYTEVPYFKVIGKCLCCLPIIIGGLRARNVQLLCRGKRISAIAAMAIDGCIGLRCGMKSVNE